MEMVAEGVWQNPAAARSNLVARVEKATAVPPKARRNPASSSKCGVLPMNAMAKAPIQPVTAPGQPTTPAITPAEIDLSCRVPLLVLFLSAAFWFLLGSICTLVCSIKFHSPNFLADAGWLTYGRLLPAGRTALLYGGCMQAGLGVGLWLLARLGRVPMRYPCRPSAARSFGTWA